MSRVSTFNNEWWLSNDDCLTCKYLHKTTELEENYSSTEFFCCKDEESCKAFNDWYKEKLYEKDNS